MYCRNCGSQRGDGQFCPSCGRPLDELPMGTAAGPERRMGTLDAAGGSSLAVEEPAGMMLAGAAVHASAAPAIPSGSHPLQREISNHSNVTVNVGGPQIIYQDKTGPGLFVRGLYFLFFGSWFGLIWLSVAVFLNTTIIGLPIGLMMINRLPMVMTLKPRNVQLHMSTNADGTYTLTRKHVDQRRFWLRALYFLFVGIWFSFAWAFAAYVIGLLLITLPISFWMWDRMPVVTTLARY